MHFSLLPTLKKNLNSIIILGAITLFSYIFSFNNQFIWDDEQFIYNNAYVKNFQIAQIFTENTTAGAGETSTYYRPLTTLSFAIDYGIWGLNPIGFHATNTALHLGAGIMLFFYLRTLQFPKLSSVTIAAIFLVHPVQTEAVVYANSRGDSMYTFWSMVSLVSFALLLKKKFPILRIYDLELILGKKTLITATIIGYIMAIFGKEIGIATLGLLGLTFLFTQLQNKVSAPLKRILTHTTGILTLFSATLSAVAYLFFRTQIIAIPTSQDIFFAGTAYGESMFVRLHTFTHALWIYVKLIVFPYPLHMERNLEVLTQPISGWLIATVMLIFFIAASSLYEYRKRKTVLITFGSLWFFGMLLPVSGIVPVNGLIYEHWLYTPIIGFCIALLGFKKIMFTHKNHAKVTTFLRTSLPFLLGTYMILTIYQNSLWAHPIRFYTHTLQYATSARLHNNLAMAYAQSQQYDNAIEHYSKAIELNDFYPQTHHNLANTYRAIGKTELAKQEYRAAIALNENFLPAYIALITLFEQEKDYESMAPLVEKLREHQPERYE